MSTVLLRLCAVFGVSLLLAIPAAAQQQSGSDIGGPFELQGVDGARFGSVDLKGKPYALFFGFTNCPEVCPMALAEMSFSLAALGEDADRLTPVFVTVDPERDTAEHLDTYLEAFDERIVGLRGTDDETAAVAGAFRATYRKVPTSGDDYTMDHTAIIYLIDANGAFFDKIDYREDHEAQLAKYRRLIAAHETGHHEH
ncbi:SCO family protein [Aquamicrobium sp. LC103]|uniref:SCO family protein n=1 Tax=Aquamicrobium sp. LC103 TaxID=1120658 RepID=UPI00063E9107|nr:SCO family protein [Aquamicrobium sp. LC103]TKT76304.1 SCO family protein [Aquamicrobium sp. LC103]